jgi:uncharacterized protein (TIGR02284 family)
MNNQYASDQLNTLIKYLHDSRNGYKAAADEIKDPLYKAWFTRLNNTRDQMLKTLQNCVQLAGEEPREHGSVTGALHRVFLDLKTLIAKDERQAIFEEVKRGEESLIKHYQEVLADNKLPADLRSKVENQLKDIQDGVQALHLH